MADMTEDAPWPALPYEVWKDTYATLHMWTQVVGKIALAQAPPVNHSWGVALHLTPRGLSTHSLPLGGRTFAVEFDFVDHLLLIRVSDGTHRGLPLVSQSVADFYRTTMSALQDLGLPVRVWPMPVEVPSPVRFDEDTIHHTYDRMFAQRVWRILLQVAHVFTATRARFLGKSSPVHFFWGSFDLAVTRFSGRPAPPREGPAFMREAYSHEVISHGFWPGNDVIPEPVFYAYAAPEPDGFNQAAVRPSAARYTADYGEFILPYDEVRTDRDPGAAIRQFVETTYAQAATLAGWDRAALERVS